MKTAQSDAQVALLAEGVDRNFPRQQPNQNDERSPSSRRAWIEIRVQNASLGGLVSPSSRRAWIEILSRQLLTMTRAWSPSSRRAWIEITLKKNLLKKQYVALLAEGVDRNKLVQNFSGDVLTSPSSRRAWIEICPRCTQAGRPQVALLAEGVDRNLLSSGEIARGKVVALLAEGVDRNIQEILRHFK